MKKYIIYFSVSIFVLIIGFSIGRNMFALKKQEDTIISKNSIDSVVINRIEKNNIEEIQTSVTENKISVNTPIIEEKYYSKCNHKIENMIRDTTKYINMTKEEFQSKFPTWEITEFGLDKVVLYKEEDDFCNEHFLVKDEDGYVTIYTIDNDKNILELLDKTDIATGYLAKVDQDNLKEGMFIYTKQNLNKLIEDFE